jgi:hypothetical protein
MIQELPDAPEADPGSRFATPPPATSAGPTEVTVHEVRGTPAGTQVTVNAFLQTTEGGRVLVSADSEGKTNRLRCEGADPAALGEAVPYTPVRVTGTVAGPEHDDTMVLTGCTAEITGEAPIDLDRPRRAPPEG